MKKRITTAVLTVVVAAAMCMPAAFSDTSAAYADDGITAVTVNTVKNSGKETSISYTDKNKIIASVYVASKGVLDIKDCTASLFTDADCSVPYTGYQDNGCWVMNSAGTYYLKVDPEDVGASPLSITAYFGKTANLDMSKTADKNTLLGFGVKGTSYVKYKAPKTACYSIYNTYAICKNNSKKTAICKMRDCTYAGLVKGHTYQFKVYSKKDYNLSVNPFEIKKITVKNKYADKFRSAKKSKRPGSPPKPCQM